MKKFLRPASIILSLILLQACKDNIEPLKSEDLVLNEILPENFTIDIPDAISFDSDFVQGGEEELIRADDIYNNLRSFIWSGESSTSSLDKLFADIIKANVDSVVSFSIISESDGRSKDFTLKQRVSLDGKNYKFQLNVDDENGTQAAQLYWNTNPIELLAILKPFDLDRSGDERTSNMFFRIEYSEEHPIYDKSMTIVAVNMPEESGLNNLQMFVGQNGDIVDVFGNSNHPDILLIDESFTGGRNYSFIGRGDSEVNVGVVLVSLPPSAVDTNEGLFEDFSVFKVLEAELQAEGITDQPTIDLVLLNASAPAFYVGDDGFVSSGANVPDNPVFSTGFMDLSSLIPFVPRDIRDLEISFSVE